MTSKILMITTAIVALSAAPVFAEGTKATGTSKATTSTTTTMSSQATPGMKGKATQTSLRAKDMKSMRTQSAQEVEMTRTLNRDSAAGRQIGQMSQTTGAMQTQGAALPKSEGAASGANQTGSTQPVASN